MMIQLMIWFWLNFINNFVISLACVWNNVMWGAGNSFGLHHRCSSGCAKWVRRNLIMVVLRFWDYGEQSKLLPDPDLHWVSSNGTSVSIMMNPLWSYSNNEFGIISSPFLNCFYSRESVTKQTSFLNKQPLLLHDNQPQDVSKTDNTSC